VQEKLTVGHPIVIADVLSRSVRILSENPALLVLQLVPVIPVLIAGLTGQFVLIVAVAIAATILTTVVSGAYPLLVSTILEGRRYSVRASMRLSYRRFWSLLGAGILVTLVESLGLVALLFPGLIFLTWYSYTVPAMMLENKGAVQAMAASRAFGRDKKRSTFVILAAVGLIAIAIALAFDRVSLGPTGSLTLAVYEVVLIPLEACVWVMLSYAYITYGPPLMPSTAFGDAVQVAAAASAPPVVPQQQRPAAQPDPSSRTAMPYLPVTNSMRFCSSCGGRVPADSRFCPSCGKPVPRPPTSQQ
jgi:hypothetical protein